jgi:hypothetical protein
MSGLPGFRTLVYWSEFLRLHLGDHGGHARFIQLSARDLGDLVEAIERCHDLIREQRAEVQRLNSIARSSDRT